jgi:hypothetical protein
MEKQKFQKGRGGGGGGGRRRSWRRYNSYPLCSLFLLPLPFRFLLLVMPTLPVPRKSSSHVVAAHCGRSPHARGSRQREHGDSDSACFAQTHWRHTSLSLLSCAVFLLGRQSLFEWATSNPEDQRQKFSQASLFLLLLFFFLSSSSCLPSSCLPLLLLFPLPPPPPLSSLYP